MPMLPAARLCTLAGSIDGALLSFADADGQMHVGLHGWRSESQGAKSPAFVELRAADDDAEEVTATILPSVGEHDIVVEPNAQVLEHGIDCVLRVLPDAWCSAFGLAKAGALLAPNDGDVSIIASSHTDNFLRLNLRTWTLVPFHERECFVANRWSIAVLTAAGSGGWSLPAT